MRQLLALITDDLTSATDCGIQVAKSGLETFVLFGEYKKNAYNLDAVVVSIDTDTRNLAPSKAYQIVRETAINIQAAGYMNIYKSLDSTLRGNLGAEIDAVMDVYDFDIAVIAPAFPHYGRTTVNGTHYLRGVPLAQTEFANDPKNPVREDNLVELFSSQSKYDVGLVRIEVLRRGNAAVSELLSALISQEIKLVVFDAKQEEDLDRIVQSVSKTVHRVLWVGSTGLARSVPQALIFDSRKKPKTETPRRNDYCLLVSGSTSEVTRTQIKALKKQTGVNIVEINLLELMHGGDIAALEMKRCTSLLLKALNERKDVALIVPPDRKEVSFTKTLGQQLGLEIEEVSDIILEAIAGVTKQIVATKKLRGLILTGGDTAKTICMKIGGIGIELLSEVEPGIPMGCLIGVSELLIITKAGGFGTPQALIDSFKMLKK
ncbi:MAG: four-carbon acid sugar kinase family protein [Candidatus Thorarchaeota archaeon]|jgi:uncharacterized protein YgbK (DUF1537 family)